MPPEKEKKSGEDKRSQSPQLEDFIKKHKDAPKCLTNDSALNKITTSEVPMSSNPSLINNDRQNKEQPRV